MRLFIFLLSILILQVPVTGCTTKEDDQSSVYSPVSGTLVIHDEPELNKVVSISFTFSSRTNARNTVANFTIPEGIIHSGGIPAWTGDMVANQTVTINTSIKVVKTGQYTIKASAISNVNGYIIGDNEYLYLDVTENSATVSKTRPVPDNESDEYTTTVNSSTIEMNATVKNK